MTLNWNLADTRRRKLLRQEINDPFSIACISNTGVREGWDCLEVAAGLGSLALWLATVVSPSGRVVATELPEGMNEVLRSGCESFGVELLCHDLEGNRLNDRFDLIHSRFVFEHIQGRDEALKPLLANLKPNGWIVIEDAWFPDQPCEGTDLYRRALKAFRIVIEQSGSDFGWASDLHHILQDLGLYKVSSTSRTDTYNGGSIQAEFWAANFFNHWDAMASLGLVSSNEIAELIQDLQIQNKWFTAPTVIGASGQVVAH